MVFAAAWVAAAVFLATSAPAEHQVLRIIAAILVGVPGGIKFAQEAGELAGSVNQTTSDRVKRCLQAAIVGIYRDDLYRADITLLSFHVWVVPTWYRKLVPYRIRRRRKPDGRKLPHWLRPRLKRLAMFRWEHHVETGLRFRKGVGIVGRCIDLNDRKDELRVILDSNAFKGALQDEAAWARAPVTVTQNLPMSHAKELANSYGQVAALVLREESGEAIGCITFDLPPRCPVRLGNPKQSKQLRQVFKSTAREVENHLTGRTH